MTVTSYASGSSRYATAVRTVPPPSSGVAVTTAEYEPGSAIVGSRTTSTDEVPPAGTVTWSAPSVMEPVGSAELS